MKYSFILEIDDISKDDMNDLISVLANNHIKFHVLKSDKELKENQKYKEVINKALKLNEKIINMRYQGFSYEQYKPYLLRQQNILKEVEHEKSNN